ncbi:hypothetical protein NDU88_006834 [Pleurodeles waltl]|uniref:Uncharacterized protein n=1 Tax=Pleurodeles waltl TaxID=8319 RepID=A0AAV7LRK5_PLEWA|nr:hypothetical protein NDU88_006834 [Pleurodeles waltl]
MASPVIQYLRPLHLLLQGTSVWRNQPPAPGSSGTEENPSTLPAQKALDLGPPHPPAGRGHQNAKNGKNRKGARPPRSSTLKREGRRAPGKNNPPTGIGGCTRRTALQAAPRLTAGTLRSEGTRCASKPSGGSTPPTAAFGVPGGPQYDPPGRPCSIPKGQGGRARTIAS